MNAPNRASFRILLKQYLTEQETFCESRNDLYSCVGCPALLMFKPDEDGEQTCLTNELLQSIREREE